jgi:hypothetical protein
LFLNYPNHENEWYINCLSNVFVFNIKHSGRTFKTHRIFLHTSYSLKKVTFLTVVFKPYFALSCAKFPNNSTYNILYFLDQFCLNLSYSKVPWYFLSFNDTEYRKLQGEIFEKQCDATSDKLYSALYTIHCYMHLTNQVDMWIPFMNRSLIIALSFLYLVMNWRFQEGNCNYVTINNK